MNRKRLYPFASILVFFSYLCMTGVESTDVKWTAGEADLKNAAHTAPRSQKYWDEHGIERPDYAKTDAELAKEKKSASGGRTGVKWLLLIPIVAGAGYYFYQQIGGHKLGGSSRGGLFHRMSEEDARQARLAKFERGISVGKAE